MEDTGLDILTPNSFLNPYASSKIYLKDPSTNICELPKRSALFKAIQIRDNMLDEFKVIWFNEYLFSLIHLHKNLHQSKFTNRIKVGDIILIKYPVKNVSTGS